jgi:hypothetical protein
MSSTREWSTSLPRPQVFRAERSIVDSPCFPAVRCSG